MDSLSNGRLLAWGLSAALLATSSASFASGDVRLQCKAYGEDNKYVIFDESLRIFRLNGSSYERCSFDSVKISCSVNGEGMDSIILNRIDGTLRITRPPSPEYIRDASGNLRHNLSPRRRNEIWRCEHLPEAKF